MTKDSSIAYPLLLARLFVSSTDRKNKVSSNPIDSMERRQMVPYQMYSVGSETSGSAFSSSSTPIGGGTSSANPPSSTYCEGDLFHQEYNKCKAGKDINQINGPSVEIWDTNDGNPHEVRFDDPYTFNHSHKAGDGDQVNGINLEDHTATQRPGDISKISGQWNHCEHEAGPSNKGQTKGQTKGTQYNGGKIVLGQPPRR